MTDYAIEIYKEVLSGTRKRFPRNFWTQDASENLLDAAVITRYLIEEILNWNDDDIRKNICCKTFFQNKLKGMLCLLFGDSFFRALDNAYPGKFKEWELRCTPRNFWNLDTARDATIWLFKEHLNMDDSQIRQNVTRQIFVANGLDTMMHVVFSNNATKAIQNAFPDIF